MTTVGIRPLASVLIASVLYAAALVAWPLWLRPHLTGASLAVSLTSMGAWALAATVAAAWLATRQLGDPLRVWQRLSPVVLVGAVALGVAFCLAVPHGPRFLQAVRHLASLPLEAFGLYCLMWPVAWVLRRRRWWGATEAVSEAPPVWKRNGVRFWLATLAAGTLLQVVAVLTTGGW